MLVILAMDDSKQALKEAIEAAGGLAGIAGPLGISRQAVFQWDEVPPLKVLEVERISGVSRYRLRPDLYPLDDTTTKPEA